jgi:hypothetical protein
MTLKSIVFSNHAEMEFGILEKHGFPISKDTALETIKSPDLTEEGYKGISI